MHARNPQQEEVPATRAILAMTENIDWNVGRLLEHLDKLHLAENTIVVYFSDNGPQTWRWNGEMKGKKGSTDEGGVRAPFLIRWPGHINGGLRIPQIAGAIDLLPTLTDLAQVPVISTKPLDGVSLKPLLQQTAKDWPDRMIFSEWVGKTSVRTQHYRLDMANALFDMDADPQQDHNVAAQHPDEAARLTKAMADWRSELLAKARTTALSPSATPSFPSPNFLRVTRKVMAASSAVRERRIAPISPTGPIPKIVSLGMSMWRPPGNMKR